VKFRTWPNAETYFHAISSNPCNHLLVYRLYDMLPYLVILQGKTTTKCFHLTLWLTKLVCKISISFANFAPFGCPNDNSFRGLISPLDQGLSTWTSPLPDRNYRLAFSRSPHKPIKFLMLLNTLRRVGWVVLTFHSTHYRSLQRWHYTKNGKDNITTAAKPGQTDNMQQWPDNGMFLALKLA